MLSRLSQGCRAFAAAAATLATLVGCGGTPDVADGVAATGPNAATSPITTDCTLATRNPAKVVCLANAFRNTLSAAQQDSLLLDYTVANATTWSNLPTNLATRVGIRLGDLSATQRAAALNLARAALSSAGYGTFQSIRAADRYLDSAQAASGANSRLAFSDSLYFISVLGTPSTTSAWILKLDGHHWAVNLHYDGAETPTATPNFVSTEPNRFTLGGVTYTPLASRRDAMYAMVNALDASQAATAQLGTSFSDVLLGPGQDGTFPTRQGIAYTALTASQQALVRAAVEQWVRVQPTAEANALLATYFSSAALDSTSIAWSGSRDSTVQGSYVRIHGPRVWIESAAQPGVVFTAIHYHTIWRDREQDYGGDFTLSPTNPGTPGTPPTGTPPSGTPPTGTPPSGTPPGA